MATRQMGYFLGLEMRSGLLLILCVLTAQAFAEADGPDFYQVNAAAKDVPVFAEPHLQSAVVATLPTGLNCLQSHGCRGGLDFATWSALSPGERQAREAENPRWCQVEREGVLGWVQARYLSEAGGCQPDDDVPKQPIFPDDTGKTLKVVGQIRGDQIIDYVFLARAGQRLSIRLHGSHSQNYFNLIGPSGRGALFVGSMSGDRFAGVAPMDGTYRMRVYLMRPAARRHASSHYSLSLAVSGKSLLPLSPHEDAMHPGTPFHATATSPCVSVGKRLACEVGVTRRGHDGTATVHIRWPENIYALPENILFVKGRPVSADSDSVMRVKRREDVLRVIFGDADRPDGQIDIVDVLLQGD